VPPSARTFKKNPDAIIHLASQLSSLASVKAGYRNILNRDLYTENAASFLLPIRDLVLEARKGSYDLKVYQYGNHINDPEELLKMIGLAPA